MDEQTTNGAGRSDLFNGRLWWRQYLTALGLLSRLRLFGPLPPPQPRGLAVAARAFVLVGATFGLAAGLTYAVLHGIGLAPFLAALGAIAMLVVLTGARGETHLAQAAERLGGTMAARLGAVGIITLLFALGARIAAVEDIESSGRVLGALLAAAAVSRALLPALVFFAPARGTEEEASARENGTDDEAAARPSERPAAPELTVGLCLAALFALLGLGGAGLIAALAAALATFGAWHATRRPGGVAFFDRLGSAQQAGEIVFLIVAAALS